MTAQRLPHGGTDLDRTRQLRFSFDGRAYQGYAGDTLASALLANNVKITGRSFKYHRPRGLMAAGTEEPNALMRVGTGARIDVNVRATEIELYDGLVARAVNCWPNARFDVGAVSGLLSRFIPAGFYYKTMMWPSWHMFEGFIRRAAGLGRPSAEPDPDRYESHHVHCDVLVVGAGPAGLTAAAAAARGGARVILCEQDARIGGSILTENCTIDDQPGSKWIHDTVEELRSHPEVVIKTRTTAVGYFDHDSIALVERCGGELLSARTPRHRLWQVRARRVVFATGAIERPIVFPGNDRPGVMLASAVRHYLMRFAVSIGQRVVIFTNNDSAYSTALALLHVGAHIVAIIDSRQNPPPPVLAMVRDRAELLLGAVVIDTMGSPVLRRVRVRDRGGHIHELAADLLAVSGGFNPDIHLFSQSGGSLRWSERYSFFEPGVHAQQTTAVGSCGGILDLSTALNRAHATGERDAASTGFPAALTPAPRVGSVSREPFHIEPLWQVDAPGKAFVDFQNDVTLDDIELAVRENFVSVEHVKRYTTCGMAPDQGKTSNVNALALIGELTGRTPSQVGTTRYRFPYAPIPMGVLGGRARGELYSPRRRLPCHAWHESHGAVFEEYSGWLRPALYLRSSESAVTAREREVLAVRESVGLFDASPLGKIIVRGPDAALFLDRIYANRMSTLAVGRLRYGIMLNELGVLIDDGVTARLAADEFSVGTSSAGATRIADWLEEWRQCEWPDLRVIIAPVSNAVSVFTLSGPNARMVLAKCEPDFPIEPGDFPHMTYREGRLASIPARVMRVSFTGEVSFEVNVSSAHAAELWSHLIKVGTDYGLQPVGIDAWMVLRTEKGYLHVGADTDGTTSPNDVGWDPVHKRNDDFVGRRSLLRPDNLRADRLQFVGFEPIENAPLPIGSHVRGHTTAQPSDGYISSAAFSPTLRRWVALGMLRAGRARLGEVVSLLTPHGIIAARVSTPCSYDPQGTRINA